MTTELSFPDTNTFDASQSSDVIIVLRLLGDLVFSVEVSKLILFLKDSKLYKT